LNPDQEREIKSNELLAIIKYMCIYMFQDALGAKMMKCFNFIPMRKGFVQEVYQSLKRREEPCR